MLEVDRDGIAGLTDAVLIIAFDGWVSAGAAGTATADHIAADCPVVVRFDPDALFDYRVSRPTAAFRNGILEDLTWPELTIRRRSAERDLLVLAGPEPNWGWTRLGSELADLAGRLEVTLQISLGGIPWAAPHTRPTLVTTTATHPDLLGDEANVMEGLLEVPAAAALTIERRLADRGIPTIGLWARVPHYVGGTYYPAVVTLAEQVARRCEVGIDPAGLVDEASEQRRRLDETMESQPQVEALVRRYEELYDAGEELGSGEEIAAEFERFLRQQTDGDTGIDPR
jgi:hypothetical protein